MPTLTATPCLAPMSSLPDLNQDSNADLNYESPLVLPNSKAPQLLLMRLRKNVLPYHWSCEVASRTI